MNGLILNSKVSFRVVGVDIFDDLNWHGHVVDLGVAARKKLKIPFKAHKFFSPNI